MYFKSLSSDIDSDYPIDYIYAISENHAKQCALKAVDEIVKAFLYHIGGKAETEGLSHKEIAERLGVSINTSKTNLMKAKSKIRDMIKKQKN